MEENLTFNTLDMLVYNGTYETIWNTCYFKAKHGNCWLPNKKEFINERFEKHHSKQEAKHHITRQDLVAAYRLIVEDVDIRKEVTGKYTKYELTEDAKKAIDAYYKEKEEADRIRYILAQQEEEERERREWLEAAEAREAFFKRWAS